MIEVDELKADAAESIKKQKLNLEEIQQLGAELQMIQGCIDEFLEKAEYWKEKYNKIAHEVLPEAMMQLGLKYFGLADGDEVNIEEIISCKIKPENQTDAHAWLRDRGHGDIIKNEVTAVFGKDEDAMADRAYNELKLLPHSSLTREEKVHPQTLKAFIKDRLRAGDEFPAELFGLYVANIARLNKAKVKK